VHYDGKWDNNKESINANYKIGSLAVTTDQVQLNRFNFDTYTTMNDFTLHQYDYTERQKLDAIYTKVLSPTSNIKLDISGTDKNTNANSTSVQNASLNDLLRTIDTKVQNNTNESKIFTADVFYTKKLKKAGRTISWDVNGNYGKTYIKQYLKDDRYTVATASDSLTDQYKPTTTTSLVLNSNFTYTEPISQKFALTFNYGLALNNSQADRLSYDKSAQGVYNVLDTIYSNNYKFNVLTNQLGAVFNLRGGGTKTILTFGTRANSVNFRQIDEFTGTIFKRNFINWKPQATFQYHPGPSTNLRLEYNGTSQQPSISQLQPVRDNSNSLNISIGNPNLQSSFLHSLSGSYRSFKPLADGQHISIIGSYSLTVNPIIGKATVDTATLRSTTQAVNFSKSTHYYNLSISTDRKIAALGMQAGIRVSTFGNSNYYINNDILYTMYTRSYSASVNLQKNKVKKYSFLLSGGPSYTASGTSPKATADNNNAPGYNINGIATVFLPLNFQISSDILDTYHGKTQSAPSLTTTMWNGAISKTFLKDDKLKLSLGANNLLNQEQNYRTQNGGYFQQVNYNSIKRFFMFTVSWDFKQFGTVKDEQP